ncbi:ABC transporter permease [Pseudochelatococcus sp. B33]
MLRDRLLLLATPLTVFNVLVFVAAMSYVFMLSLVGAEYFLGNYVEVLSDPLFQSVLGRTLWISTISALISVVLGYIVAYHMWVSPGRMRAYLTLIVVSPLLISVVVRTFGWIVLLGGSGPLASTLELLGLPPIRLLYTTSGVIIALVHIHLPYAVIGILAALDGINPLLLRASNSLGARPHTVFTTVVLPLSIPGVVVGGLLAFVLNLGSFVTPLLIGGPRQLTLGGYVHQEVMLFFNEGVGYASSVIVLVLAVALTLGASQLGRRRAWQTATFG